MNISLINLQSSQTIDLDGFKPLVIGRGEVTGCSDKRVSRKHCQLLHTQEEKLLLKALHTNPVFFMKDGLPPILQIKKDEEKQLCHGDYIALLPDSYWYQIVIKNDNSNNLSSVNDSRNITPKKLNDSNLRDTSLSDNVQPSHQESNVSPTKLIHCVKSKESCTDSVSSPLPGTSKEIPLKCDLNLSLNDEKGEPKKRILPSWMTTEQQMSPSTSRKVPEVEKSTGDLGPHHPGISEELKRTRKLPLDRYEVKNQQIHKDRGTIPIKRQSSSPLESVITKKAKELALNTIEDEDNFFLRVANALEEGNEEEKVDQTDEKKKDLKRDMTDVEVDMKLENDVEETNFKTELKNEEKGKRNSTETAVEASEEAPNSEPVPQEDEKGETSKENNEKEGYESDVVDPEEGNSKNNTTQNGLQRRPLCQYEERCYRKNSQHKLDFSHPGDADFIRREDRPHCQYGASCYRQNAFHRVEYQHPPGTPARPPQAFASTPPASPPSVQRKRKVNYRQSSDEDDYDLEDPFINDGTSDEYQPTDDSSSEEGTDMSQGDEENLKRLRKNPNKITKKRRKK